MRRFRGLVCAVGLIGFRSLGLITVTARFGDRPLDGMHVALAGTGLFIGIPARAKVNEATRNVPVGGLSPTGVVTSP